MRHTNITVKVTVAGRRSVFCMCAHRQQPRGMRFGMWYTNKTAKMTVPDRHSNPVCVHAKQQRDALECVHARNIDGGSYMQVQRVLHVCMLEQQVALSCFHVRDTDDDSEKAQHVLHACMHKQ
eukprot:1154694-Pelagomonas_calceolata.AAC.1